ncbi:hypothetical protein NUU61_003297 [Penicillium alfredii]|uniref:Uncharacterized protein n=1 Tax=Penicillium alfredii TaxID=1506179 RepID=A0A9W9FTS9_9EURO|nr:uncharacterized protein NUU61_003297 [Penicillium alfredii]KAJ5105950.1 hypothetical protein NUU61_003297 [Penicillium alfredii]
MKLLTSLGFAFVALGTVVAAEEEEEEEEEKRDPVLKLLPEKSPNCGKTYCWSKCSTDSMDPVSGDWQDGQPWCYLQDENQITQQCGGPEYCETLKYCNNHFGASHHKCGI